MSRSLAPWMLVALLALGLGARLLDRQPRGTGFATLPILVPTSLVYEAELRAARGLPAGDGGADAVAVAEALLAAPLPPGAGPELRAEFEALAAARADLLALRDRRHALNVRAMEVGVAVASRLTPAQWDAVQGQRDAVRARAEAATFERVRRKLAAAP